MSIAKNNLKSMLLLFSMTVFCVGIIFVVNQFHSEEYVQQGKAQETKTMESEVKLLSEDDTAVAEKVTVDKVATVLSTTDTKECKQATTKITSYSVCERKGSGKVDYKGGSLSGEMVHKNSEVALVEVVVPLELLSGSEVKDSNRKLTSTTPVYKAAGEQIDEKVSNVLLYPGQQIGEYKPAVQDKSFSFDSSTAFEQKSEDSSSSKGEVVVDKKIVNACEHCKNKSNVNPDKSNKISSFMLDILYRIPGEKAKVDEADVIESCSENDRFEEWKNNKHVACVANLATIVVTLVKQISSSTWNECNGVPQYDENGNIIPPSEDCIYPENIVVKMSSVFGSDSDCKDEVCTNAYMNTRNKIALSPKASTTYSDKFYYTTECKVLIEGKPYTVRCAWDMSHLYKERKLAEYDDLPNIEKTPSTDAYNEFLLNEGIRRQSEPSVQLN